MKSQRASPGCGFRRLDVDHPNHQMRHSHGDKRDPELSFSEWLAGEWLWRLEIGQFDLRVTAGCW
jgi:hypothetical protein